MIRELTGLSRAIVPSSCISVDDAGHRPFCRLLIAVVLNTDDRHCQQSRRRTVARPTQTNDNQIRGTYTHTATIYRLPGCHANPTDAMDPVPSAPRVAPAPMLAHTAAKSLLLFLPLLLLTEPPSPHLRTPTPPPTFPLSL